MLAMTESELFQTRLHDPPNDGTRRAQMHVKSLAMRHDLSNLPKPTTKLDYERISVRREMDIDE